MIYVVMYVNYLKTFLSPALQYLNFHNYRKLRFLFFASQLETVIQDYWSKKLLILLPFQCQCHFQKCFPFSSLTLPICLHFWFGDDMNKINPKQPYLNIILSQTFMSWLRGMKQTFWISIINPYCERDCTQEYESPYFFIISSFLNFYRFF